MKLAWIVELKKAPDNNLPICIKTTFLKQLVTTQITFLVALPVPSKIVLTFWIRDNSLHLNSLRSCIHVNDVNLFWYFLDKHRTDGVPFGLTHNFVHWLAMFCNITVRMHLLRDGTSMICCASTVACVPCITLAHKFSFSLDVRYGASSTLTYKMFLKYNSAWYHHSFFNNTSPLH